MLVFKRRRRLAKQKNLRRFKGLFGGAGGGVEEAGSQETEKFKFCFGSP